MTLMKFVLLPDFASYSIALSWGASDRLIDCGVGCRSRLNSRRIMGQFITPVEFVAFVAVISKQGGIDCNIPPIATPGGIRGGSTTGGGIGGVGFKGGTSGGLNDGPGSGRGVSPAC